jgi:hypothetical protein
MYSESVLLTKFRTQVVQHGLQISSGTSELVCSLILYTARFKMKEQISYMYYLKLINRQSMIYVALNLGMPMDVDFIGL